IQRRASAASAAAPCATGTWRSCPHRCTSADVRRLLAVAAIALIGSSSGVALAQRTPAQPALHDFAVLGLDGVTLRAGWRVPTGAVGAVAGMVRVGRDVRVSGSVAADVVQLARTAKHGRLFCRLVVGAAFGRGVVGGPAVEGASLPGCLSLTLPLVDPLALAPVPVIPGDSDLRIPPRTGTAPLAEGSYGAVVVGPGSLLQLAGGTIAVRSIRIARRGRMVCTATCRIEVLEDVELRPGAQLGAAAPLRAREVRIDVAASGLTRAFLARPRAAVAATVFAPTGDVVLGRDGEYRGAYVGRTVTVRPGARVRGDSAP